MKLWKLQPKNIGLLTISTVVLAGSTLFLPVFPVNAQELLQEQGTLEPVEDEYTFSGEAGQSVAITLTSTEFDPVLVLLGSNDQEIAYNDDYARSLNSTVIVTLPSDGVYKAVARSLTGSGGSYTIAIRPATPYDQAYAQAIALAYEGMFSEAIAAYTEAIDLEPNQPATYVDRADARYGQLYVNDNPETEAEELEAVIADYERAVELYEQAGDAEAAQSLREELTYLQMQPEP